jgi:hypothetical protein
MRAGCPGRTIAATGCAPGWASAPATSMIQVKSHLSLWASATPAAEKAGSPAAPGMRSPLASPDLRYFAANQVDVASGHVRTGSLRVTISATISDGYGPLGRRSQPKHHSAATSSLARHVVDEEESLVRRNGSLKTSGRGPAKPTHPCRRQPFPLSIGIMPLTAAPSRHDEFTAQRSVGLELDA